MSANRLTGAMLVFMSLAFLVQSVRVWLLEQRNEAEQDELKKLRRAFRSRFKTCDKGSKAEGVEEP